MAIGPAGTAAMFATSENLGCSSRGGRRTACHTDPKFAIGMTKMTEITSANAVEIANAVLAEKSTPLIISRELITALVARVEALEVELGEEITYRKSVELGGWR